MDWKSLIDENGHAVIPEGVTEISYEAFKNCDGLVSIDIPGSVHRVDNLSRLDTLKYVTLHKGTTIISVSAFRGSHIESIDIPETVTEIEWGAFECTRLESVKIPDGVESIGEYAFKNCSFLGSIEIPRSVKKIGKRAFAYCGYLKSIHISPDNINFRSENNCCLSKDGKSLIFGCSTSVIPDGVTVIEDSAFYGSGISEIKMPSSVEKIEDSAFCECEQLIKVDLSPASVRHIGDNAFNSCKKLSYIYLPDTLHKVYKDTFQGCGNLETISISGGLVDICPDAFQWNTKLTRINVRSYQSGGPIGVGLIMIDGHPVYRKPSDAEFIHYHFPYANEVI